MSMSVFVQAVKAESVFDFKCSAVALVYGNNQCDPFSVAFPEGLSLLLIAPSMLQLPFNEEN